MCNLSCTVCSSFGYSVDQEVEAVVEVAAIFVSSLSLSLLFEDMEDFVNDDNDEDDDDDGEGRKDSVKADDTMKRFWSTSTCSKK